MKELILTALESSGIAIPNEKVISRLVRLSEMLEEHSKVMNLTAIKDSAGIALLHIADSLTLLPYIPSGATFIDVGTGAGFPALPIAAAREDVRAIALDSTAKKLGFVADAAAGMGIANLKVLCARAESAAKDQCYRENFSVVTARAVARLNILCELCLPFCEVGGIFISMKSRLACEEINEARQAIKILGGEIAENVPIILSDDKDSVQRNLIIIQKNKPTSDLYPRNYSAINKKPL